MLVGGGPARGVLLAVLATAPAATSAAGPVAAPAVAAPAVAGPAYVRVSAPDTVPVHTRALLRARVDGRRPCGRYAACRTAAVGGTVTWTLVSGRDPDVHLRHVSTVEDGRARWRTPRVRVPGRWHVRAAYAAADGQHLADHVATFRVTRP